jgi:selenide,water dikinase
VRSLPRTEHPDLLLGAEHFADAGVYRVAPETAIVQSVDFFSPIVDDPAAFGRIAAANALSDVYAMGARPITALNLVLFPDDQLPLDVLEEILGGAAGVLQQSGAVTLGGHSVRSKEIVFGLAVTGVVHPDRYLTNAGARPGDAVVLTKGLGTGVIATASRGGTCPPEAMAAAITSMSELNDLAAAAACEHGATAITDITGYGFAVHALELAEASGVGLVIDSAALPVIAGAMELATPAHRSRASGTNRERSGDAVRLDEAIEPARAELIFDPQTSGGLLVTAPAPAAARIVGDLGAAGRTAAIIGHVVAEAAGEPRIRFTAGG